MREVPLYLGVGARRAGGLLRGDRGRPGSPGCHEESEARMVKVNFLTLSDPPAGLSKLLYRWPERPTPLLLTWALGRGAPVACCAGGRDDR